MHETLPRYVSGVGMFVGSRVAVDLAAREEEEALESVRPRLAWRRAVLEQSTAAR